MELHTIGIDLGKTVFHLVGLNLRGEVVVHKKFSRKQLLHFTANLKVELIGMEACGGAHFLGRALREQGHEVRLMPAQYVKPYVKTNKSDYIDAEAIAEAVGRGWPNSQRAPTTTSLPWRWRISWPAWPGPCSRRMNPIGLPCWSMWLQPDWPADDAWLRPGLEIAFAIPTSPDQRLLRS